MPIAVHADGAGLCELSAKVEEYGFAVAAMTAELPAESALELLAERLGLGDPYIPALYRRPDTIDRYACRYVRIERNDSHPHPGFATTSGQDMHVDGLLEDIGAIRTSALFCIRPAAVGGATVIFNAVKAFDELRSMDPAAAEVLTHPTVLLRRASLPDVDEARFGPAVRSGPAFAVGGDGTITNRFSDGSNGEWHAPADRRDELARALKFLRDAAEFDGRYRIPIMLRSGQCLLSRNDRVSHGREAYQDSPDSPRVLVRAVYTEAPYTEAPK
jgi:hypothetical protein